MSDTLATLQDHVRTLLGEEFRDRAESAATRAETAATTAEMWAASMADALLTESPPGSGLFLFGGQSPTENPGQ